MMRAPGKINLFLRVTGRRDDGYTDIETVFLPLLLHDKLDFDFSAGELALECNDPELQSPDNLVLRAAKLYGESCNVEVRSLIRLEKRLFTAAGLGGGSSDAATTLLACEDHYAAAGNEKLRLMARKLGADVPFFLSPAPALGRGIGDDLTPLKLTRKLHIVLVNPHFGVSARWAYAKAAIRPETKQSGPLIKAMASGDFSAIAAGIANDLAEAVYEKFPITAMIRKELLRAGAAAADISGSGPTLFALAANIEQAAGIKKHIEKIYGPAVTAAVTESL